MEYLISQLIVTWPILFSLINLFPVPKFHWLFEVNLALGPYYLALHLIGLAYVLIRRGRFRWLGFAIRVSLLLLCSCWYFNKFAVFYRAPLPTKIYSPHGSFTLLYANVYTSNSSHQLIKEEIERRSPDIVALIEVNAQWLNDLALGEKYKYKVEVPQEDNFGMALYSDRPFLNQPDTQLGPDLPPIINVALNPGDGEPVYFTLFHAFPPASQENLYGRKVILKRVTGKMRFEPGRIILAGDLNANPLSHVYEQFVDSDFYNAMWGYGLTTTWRLLRLPLLRSTIDHIFYRGSLRVEEFQRLPDVGSDHYPLFVRFKY